MKTLYRQLLASMLIISIVLPLVILVSFNIAMRTNAEMSAREELNSTITTMQKLIESSAHNEQSSLLNELAAALTSTKLTGNTNFYIVRDDAIAFKSENEFEIDSERVKELAKNGEKVKIHNINNNNCYVSAIELKGYAEVKNASMVFVTNTLRSMANLKTINIILITIICISVCIAVTYSIRVAANISKPIKDACTYANEVGNGIFNKEIYVRSNKEIEELYESLNQMSKKLQENDENQKKFYQNISHEFRNPLMSIQGYAEGIEQGVLSDNTMAAEVIKQESLKLNDMVTELLTLSRMDSKVYKVDMKEYFAKEIMLDYIQSIQGMAIASNIEIKENIDDKMKICVDEQLLSKAVTNIISNCIKYAASSVNIDGFMQENIKVIEIYDDGKGTVPEALPHLFERFYKGEHGNFGLGLAIAKEAIETMNGKISVYNLKDDLEVDGMKKIRFRIEFS